MTNLLNTLGTRREGSDADEYVHEKAQENLSGGEKRKTNLTLEVTLAKPFAPVRVGGSGLS